MFPKLKERIVEILFSSQLWIAIAGGLSSLAFISLFDFGFIKLHVVQPELKHLIVTEFIFILVCVLAMITPGFVAANMLNTPSLNKDSSHKTKKARLEAVRDKIKFRKATNTILFPFIVFFNPLSVHLLSENQYLLLGITVLILSILWMAIDFILYAKIYSKYFNINNIKNKIWYTIKNNIYTNVIFLRAFIILLNLSIFIIVAQKSVLLENNFTTYEDYLDAFIFELAILIPSIIFMCFTGVKRWIYSMISALLICCLSLSHVKEIFIPWLSRNHFYNFDDYKFIFSKNACDDLEFSKIELIKSDYQTCKIATDYKTLSAVGDFYRIKIENKNGSSSIEEIRKKDIRHIHEIERQNPQQKDLDKIVQSFSKFYNVPLFIAIKHWQEYTLNSQNGINDSNITLSEQNDKAITLAEKLDYMDGLIKLTDKASYVSPHYHGTILEELKNDQNNQFYNSLINKLKAISLKRSNIDTHKRFLAYFHSVAKNAPYTKYFPELGYWSVDRINQREVITLYHHEPNLKILALYIKENDLAIAIAVDTPNFALSLNDPRIRNLVEKILNL